MRTRSPRQGSPIRLPAVPRRNPTGGGVKGGKGPLGRIEPRRHCAGGVAFPLVDGTFGMEGRMNERPTYPLTEERIRSAEPVTLAELKAIAAERAAEEQR